MTAMARWKNVRRGQGMGAGKTGHTTHLTERLALPEGSQSRSSRRLAPHATRGVQFFI